MSLNMSSMQRKPQRDGQENNGRHPRWNSFPSTLPSREGDPLWCVNAGELLNRHLRPKEFRPEIASPEIDCATYTATSEQTSNGDGEGRKHSRLRSRTDSSTHKERRELQSAFPLPWNNRRHTLTLNGIWRINPSVFITSRGPRRRSTSLDNQSDNSTLLLNNNYKYHTFCNK